MQFEKLIRKIAILLDENRIEYMLVGGQAVLRYGKARMTEDIDVSLGLDPADHGKLTQVLEHSKLISIVPDVEYFLRKTFVLPVQDAESGIRIDFIFALSEYERLAIGRANRLEMGGVAVNYISVEDLVIHKLVASRPRDIEDIRYVIYKNPDIDRAYINEWLSRFDRELETNFVTLFRDMDPKV